MKKALNSTVASWNRTPSEIDLFTELMSSLNQNVSLSCFVKSVHSHAGFVDFQCELTNKMEKVEIADLQILNFNQSKHQLRLCFLQAKYKRHHYRKFITFAGDNYQRDLLSRRCAVVDTYQNGFPSNILSFTDYRTITSYGLFYRDKQGSIDLLFTLPEFLRPYSSVKKATRFQFPGSSRCPDPHCRIAHPDETISICSIDGFESELINGNIGAPIDAGVDSYISTLLQSMYQRTGDPSILRFQGIVGDVLPSSSDGISAAPNNINTFLVVTTGNADNSGSRHQ